MSFQNPAPLSVGAEAAVIFLTALGGFCLALLIKLFIISPAHNDPDKWEDAKFDLFRVGTDLSLIGLTTYFAAFKLAQEKVLSIAPALVSLNELITITHLLLLLATTALMTYFRSPKDKSWFRSVWAPMLIGGFSVLFSGALFYFFFRG